MPPRSAPMLAEVLAALYDGLDRQRIDEVLGSAERELAEVVRDWPSWARSLVDLLEAADGSSQGVGAGVSDPTLGAVARREPLTRDRADVFGYLDDALYALKQARHRMATLVRTASAQQLQADLASHRCMGGMGLPRAELWAPDGPNCRAVAVRRGMCWKHYQACLDDEREYNMRTAGGYR